MALNSEFTYGYQLSEETNGLEFRFLIPEILNKYRHPVSSLQIYAIEILSSLQNILDILSSLQIYQIDIL